MSVLGAAGGAYTKGAVGSHTDTQSAPKKAWDDLWNTMSPEEQEEYKKWVGGFDATFQDYNSSPTLDRWLKDRSKGKYRAGFDYQNPTGAQPQAAAAGAGGGAPFDYEAAIAEFIRELQQPLNLEDPHVKAIASGAYRMAEQDARGRGLQAINSIPTAEQSSLVALGGLEAQRRGQLQQALGLGSGRDVSLQGLGFQQQQWQQQQAQDAADRAHAANAARMQAIGGLAGGLLGGAAGGLGLGGMNMGQGLQFGSQFGAGLGGLAAGGSTAPAAPRQPRSNTRGSGY